MSPTCRSDALNESRKSSAAATWKQEREKNFRLRLPAACLTIVAWTTLRAIDSTRLTVKGVKSYSWTVLDVEVAHRYIVCVCVKCVTSKQRLVWVGPIHRDRLEQLRSICNISRSCGPNNLGGKWVMTVALGPDTLTMFDELPKGWGDDHLNDHTTERNGTEYDGISRWVCSQNPQHIFGLPVSYQPAWQLHMYAHTCAYVYTQYYSHSLASAGVDSFECITHLSL